MSVREGGEYRAKVNVHLGTCGIAAGARATRTAVWDGVTVHRGSEVTDCVVADGVEIPPGTRLEGCAIVPAGSRPPDAGQRLFGRLLVAPFVPSGPRKDSSHGA